MTCHWVLEGSGSTCQFDNQVTTKFHSERFVPVDSAPQFCKEKLAAQMASLLPRLQGSLRAVPQSSRFLGSFHANLPETPTVRDPNEGDISPSVSTPIPGPRTLELVKELEQSSECGAVHFMVSYSRLQQALMLSLRRTTATLTEITSLMLMATVCWMFSRRLRRCRWDTTTQRSTRFCRTQQTPA